MIYCGNQYCIYIYIIFYTCTGQAVYWHVGRIIALSIIHGGPAPVFLAQQVVDYLLDGITTIIPPPIDAVEDEEVRSKIQKVYTIGVIECLFHVLIDS